MKTTQFIDPYKLVTDTIIAQLEKGVVPWRCPWQRNIGMPRNFQTGQEYRGVNVILLGLHRFASPYWMTWNQIKQRGGSVKKGEHGSLVVKYGKFKRKTENEEGMEKKKSRSYIKGYKVFNAVQIDGIEFPPVTGFPKTKGKERIAAAERIVGATPFPPHIREGSHDQAYYRLATDTVDMPSKASFEKVEDFYATLFHELVHATGHPSRLNRKSLLESENIGGEIYSQEELVAEIGAAFLVTEADIVRDEHEQSAAYLKSWLDVLKDEDHKRWIVKAANLAAKAADFILNRMARTEYPA